MAFAMGPDGELTSDFLLRQAALKEERDAELAEVYKKVALREMRIKGAIYDLLEATLKTVTDRDGTWVAFPSDKVKALKDALGDK